MKTVLVLFGGRSSEYEVSLQSAFGALSNIDRETYRVLCGGITREGRFYLYDGDISHIPTDKWHCGGGVIHPLSLDLSTGKLFYTEENVRTDLDVDVVLPMIHGKFCEDGTLQGMFAVAGIPVVGCDCQSSAVSMDKAQTKAVVSAECGIRQAASVVAKSGEIVTEEDVTALRKRCEKALGYPMFIKPARAGSSVGASKVKTADSFAAALDAAFREDTKVLIEECIVGVEVEVAVLEEHGKYLVAHPAEIDVGTSEFYDYETKYVSDASSYYLPARLSAEKQDEVRGYAEKIFRALDCRGFSRVDFFYTKAGEFVFNEINTLPGFTPISMYPKMILNEGISYAELLSRLIESAL